MTPMLTNDDEAETYFSHKERMFPDLHENGAIPTEQFLIACQGIADFVGFLGTAFIPVKNDIGGNVTKVKTMFESDPNRMHLLQDLIDIDLSENNGSLGIATEGLLWLKRGLEFMLELLKALVRDYKNSAENTESLSPVLREVYEKTLKRHHNFVSKQLFKIMVHAAPYRKTLLRAMAFGKPGLEDACINHISELLGNFEQNVNSLVNYYYLKKMEVPRPI